MIQCFFVRVLSLTHTQTGSLWGTWSPSVGSGSSGLQVKILKGQLITKLTVRTGCGADFWEFLPVVSRKSPLWISTTIMAASCAGSVIIYVYMRMQRVCAYIYDWCKNIFMNIQRVWTYVRRDVCVYVYMSVYIYIYKLMILKERTLLFSDLLRWFSSFLLLALFVSCSLPHFLSLSVENDTFSVCSTCIYMWYIDSTRELVWDVYRERVCVWDLDKGKNVRNIKCIEHERGFFVDPLCSSLLGWVRLVRYERVTWRIYICVFTYL